MYIYLQLMKWSRRILGKRLFEILMQQTFYGQFVAGEDSFRIRPLVDRMKCYGVKSILDYSVEKDLSKEEAEESETK